MKSLVLAISGLVFFTISTQNSLAQPHRPAQPKPAASHLHPAVGGHITPETIQRQAEQAQQQEVQQYRAEANRFASWLQTNGQQANPKLLSRIPSDPYEFEAWVSRQRYSRSKGGSSDPLYSLWLQYTNPQKNAASSPSANALNAQSSSNGHRSNGTARTINQATDEPHGSGRDAQTTEPSQSRGRNHSSTAQAKAQASSKSGAQAGHEQAELQIQDQKRNRERQKKPEPEMEERKRKESEARKLREQQWRKEQERLHHRLMAGETFDAFGVQLLKIVHADLSKADTDYAGHRVLAMGSVTRAIHHLGGSAILESSSGGNLAQGQSDGLLRKSLDNLRRVDRHLSQPHAHSSRATARHEVTEAMRQLEVALRMK